MIPVRLFLLAVDGSDPANWKPFGKHTLREIAGDYKEEAENRYCMTSFRIELSTIHVNDITKEMLTRVVGLIIDLRSSADSDESLRRIAHKLRKKPSDLKPLPLFALLNINLKSPGSSERIDYLRKCLSLQGYRGNEILMYPLSEDEDIRVAMAIISANISTNELIFDALGLI